MAKPSTHDERRRFRRPGLLVAALAFLLQIVAWAWIPAGAMAQPSNDGEGLIVCTGDGLIKLLPDGSRLPVDPSEKGGAMAASHCPLCPLVGGLAPPPPMVMADAPVATARHLPRTLPGNLIVAGWFLATLQARAPPTV